jgi:hypothetical protein
MIDHIKGAWRSWTIHFNLWMGTLLGALPLAQESFPQLQPYVPANLFQYGMAALIVGNFLLRFKTTGSLADKVAKGQA